MFKEMKRVVEFAARNFKRHECTMRSAALAFYGLLALFPLLLFMVFMGTMLLTSDTAEKTVIAYLGYLLPVSTENIQDVIDYILVRRGSIGLVAGIGLLWAGSSVFGVLASALNAIWDANGRPFLQRRALAAVSVLILGIAFLASFYIGPIIAFLAQIINVGESRVVGSIIEFVFATIVCYLLFRVFPNCFVARQPAWIGALVSGALIEITKLVFSVYIKLAVVNYGYLYGSIAWIVALGLWVYLVGVMVFFGAEIAAVLDKQTGNLA